jgi:hypothetical protein
VIGELDTYALSNFLMLSRETYLRLYELYNVALWPGQLAAAALTAAVIVLARRPGPGRGRLVTGLLAAAWATVGALFFFRHYATINLAAPWLGAGFFLQTLLLLIASATGWLRFAWGRDVVSRLGLGLLVYAAVIHPLVGPATGRSWSGSELFGLAPDPTALGTLGLLLMTTGRTSWWLAVLPLLWCLVSGLTHWVMDHPAGLITPVLGLAALVALIVRGVGIGGLARLVT